VEDEIYSRFSPPYKTKNAPFESVEELRLVAGMTAEVLYGEDANLNGILDSNENDSDISAPYDNRDGRLDPGLLEYFTVYSYEPMTGTNINSRQDLQSLLEGFLNQQRVTEILRNFPTGGGGGQPGGGQQSQLGSVLEFYLRSGMTQDEFEEIADYLAPTTNILVNVNTASQYVLECIPGIGIDYAAQLISYRESNPSRLATVAWVAEAIGSDTNAVAAGPYITTRSYQYTADIAAVGRHNRGYQRVRYVFDTSEGAPIIVRRQDLTHLGWALGKDTRTELLAWKERQ
jgi:type II secretory pathway component PulK